MLGWMKHKLESRFLAQLSITSDMQMIPPFMAEIKEELKSLLMQVKEESEKPALKLSSVQFTHSVVSDSLRPHESQHARLSITNSWSSLRLTPIESVMPSSHLILCLPFLLLPPIPPSIKVFSNDSTLRMRLPKHWSFSFSI